MRHLIQRLEEGDRRTGGDAKQADLTADEWRLYPGAGPEVVRALNQAIRQAAMQVQREVEAQQGAGRGGVKGAIERALDDVFDAVAQRYRKAGAGDTAVRDVAFEVLRKRFQRRR